MDCKCEADDVHSEAFDALDDGFVGLVLKPLGDHGFEVGGPVGAGVGYGRTVGVFEPAAGGGEGGVEGGCEGEEAQEGEEVHCRCSIGLWVLGVGGGCWDWRLVVVFMFSRSWDLIIRYSSTVLRLH